MNLLIDNRSGVPIYIQIYNQIRSQITDGTITEDEALPSIRSLARDLRISVITTKRAYEELEKDGYIYTVAGKGSFAAERNMNLVREEKLIRIEQLMNEIMETAGVCGLSREELTEMWNTMLEDMQ